MWRRLRLIHVMIACIFVMQTMLLRPYAANAQIAAESLTDFHVQKATDAIIEALYVRKHPQRFWDPERTPSGESKRQGGGYTALTALALVYAGQSYQDPRLRDAIEHLAALEMQGTYAITTRALLWAKLPPRFQQNLERDIQLLLDGFNPTTACWDYVPDAKAKYHDNSIRQFGALALWEAARRGVKFDQRIWQLLENKFIELQRTDGGWNYKNDDPTTGSMTAAGLASLFITQDLLHAGDAIKIGARKSSLHEQSIERGMAWMDNHFSPTANPGKDTHFYYYLYGVERVGLASGYKFLGGRDWFREGAAEIIDRLCKWDSASESFAVRSNAKTGDLAFALMFMSRGRVPVAVNKLQFDGAWNNRPRDVANVTRWIGQHSERDLNWQIVDIKSDPETWLDAPMLYIASHEALPWVKIAGDVSAYVREFRAHSASSASDSPDSSKSLPTLPDIVELTKLKQYLDQGGMLFAANEGNLRQFAESIEKAGQLMYPMYDWRTLPDDHWAYTVHTPVRSRKPTLRGLSNGVRDLIILSPGGDMPAAFQQIEDKHQGYLHTAANLYLYASELTQAPPRLSNHTAISRKLETSSPNSLTIVRAMYDGNWCSEPLALQRFIEHASQSQKMRVTIVDHPLNDIHRLAPPPALVIVSGVDAREFTANEMAAIEQYISAGGTILFETTGGRGEFTNAAEVALQKKLGKAIEPLLDSAIISGSGLANSANCTQVEYRQFLLQSLGTRETAPRLRGITLDAKRGPQIIFSRDDLMHALLDQPRWGISGYTPKSARDLLMNIVFFASQKKQPTSD